MEIKIFNSKKYGKIIIELDRTDSFYKFTSSVILTKEEALIIQTRFGYHPAGYGFYNFKETTWECASSC